MSQSFFVDVALGALLIFFAGTVILESYLYKKGRRGRSRADRS